MSQVGSNLRFSQLHPREPNHSDQSQGSKFTHTYFYIVEIACKGCGTWKLIHWNEGRQEADFSVTFPLNGEKGGNKTKRCDRLKI